MESLATQQPSNGTLIKAKDEIGNEEDKLKVPLLDQENNEKKQDLSVLYVPRTRERTISKNTNSGDDDQPTEGVKFIGLGDDDSIFSSKTDEITKSKIPDGGWGWVVVGSAFVISMIADGLAFTFGLLHVAFINEFKESQSKTSWIGSLFISVPLLAGPIMSALVDRYGCRSMTIAGGIVSTIGFLLASISRSIEMVFLTFGVIAGLGLGICYVTAVVSIAYWFDKKRNLAVSLGACGIGFGTVVYSPLINLFLSEYGWRGALVMLSGTVLNICVCGAVMRDPEWLQEEHRKRSKLAAYSSTSISARSARSGGADSVYPALDELRALLKSGESPEYILTKLATSIAVAENLDQVTRMNADGGAQPKVNSVISLPTFLKQSEKVPIEVLESLSSNKRLYNIILENYPSLLALRSNSEQKLPIEEPPKVPKNKPIIMSMKLKVNKKKEVEAEKLPEALVPIPENKKLDTTKAVRIPAQDWLKRQLSNHHYLRDLRLQRHSMVHRGAMMNISKYKLRASSCPNIYRNSMLSLETDEEEMKWYTRALEEFKKTFDFQMFCEFHFLLMNLSTILLFVWFIVPYFYLVAFMKENSYEPEDSGKMFVITGAANTVGIVALGWAGDQPWLNVTKTYAVCLILCGISTLTYPLIINSLWMLSLNSAIFGLTFASSYSYTPTILVELVALDKFTIAYGLILLSQGVGHLIGPPIAGLLYDITLCWDLSFYCAGVCIIFSGVLIGVIPYTNNFRMCGSAPLDKDSERVSQISQKGSSIV